MEQKAIRVTVWNEFIHEKIDPEVTKIYPQGIHSVIAGFLGQEGMRVRTATLDMPEHGLTAEVLAETDVLIWWAHIATQLLVFAWIFYRLRPSFHHLGKRLREILHFNRTYGFHLYLGAVFALGMSSLGTVLIGYFGSDTSGVAFYSLAIMFSTPLSIIPNTIATTHYRQFSQLKKIPSKLTWLTLFISFLSLIALWILLPPFIHFFYGAEFEEAVRLNRWTSAGMMLYGIADYFNRFLGAHGLGKAIRNGAFFTSLLLFIFNLLLIPKYQAFGAAWGVLAAGIGYSLIMLFYYTSYKKGIGTL